ncbi:MAG: glycosyltransferase family 4 protein [Acidobacteriota bacterium]
MSDPLRILHLIDKTLLTTGSVVQMMEAARVLAGRGHRVAIASRRGSDLREACAAAGVQFFSLPLRGPLDLRSAWRLRQRLHDELTDVIHVYKGGPHSVALLAALGLGSRPVLVVNRGVSFPLDTVNRYKYRHPRVKAVVCVADAVRELVIETGRLDPRRVYTIHGGTDCTVFDPTTIDAAEARRGLGFGHQNLVIGQVSVRDWKGWSHLVHAFKLVAESYPAARLLFVGCEPAAERLKVEEASRAAGVSGRVVTLPFRRDLPCVLAACDVVVDASVAGTGITGSIREAMALERAVVATDCGGNRELVGDGETGLVVPPGDVGALAEALTRLFDDPALRRRLGAAARKRVLGHFTTEQRVDKLEALYRKVLGSVESFEF